MNETLPPLHHAPWSNLPHARLAAKWLLTWEAERLTAAQRAFLVALLTQRAPLWPAQRLGLAQALRDAGLAATIGGRI